MQNLLRKYYEKILLLDHINFREDYPAFSGGESPYRYIEAFGCHLFLSLDGADVQGALEQGIAAATLLPSGNANRDGQLRFAFDGDAVLFSDEAERVYKQHGLDVFAQSEKAAAKVPLSGGPFRAFLSALHNLQAEFSNSQYCPIRTALVTARSAPAHERVIRTLRAWDVRIDESLFLGGLSKGEFLKSYGADVFFDDQPVNCLSAKDHVATGYVPHGIANQSPLHSN